MAFDPSKQQPLFETYAEAITVGAPVTPHSFEYFHRQALYSYRSANFVLSLVPGAAACKNNSEGNYAAKPPTMSTYEAACYDVYANIPEPITFGLYDRVKVPLGFRIALAPGWEMQVRPRSGNAINKGWMVINSPGTVDSDFRGEVCALIINLSPDGLQTIVPGQKIAQVAFRRVPLVGFSIVSEAEFDEMCENETNQRGAEGFGSSGDS